MLDKQSSKNLNSSDSPGPLLNVNFLLNYSAPHLNDFVALHFVQSNEILHHYSWIFIFSVNAFMNLAFTYLLSKIHSQF